MFAELIPLLAEEPPALGLALTGLATIGLYLAVTGRWRNLRTYKPDAAAEPAGVDHPPADRCERRAA